MLSFGRAAGALLWLGIPHLCSAVDPVIIEVGPGRAHSTLENARNQAREFQGSRTPVIVRVHPGDYTLSSPLEFDARDSGTPGAPRRWEAAGPGVRITGARPVAKFAPVRDESLRQRLPAATRDQVVMIDLRAEGITDFGQVAQRGNPGIELFFRGERQPVARYPNEGWLLVADVPQTGARRYIEGVPAGRHYGRFNYAENRPSEWKQTDGIFAHGYWTFDWSDSFQRVASIDPARREVTLAEPHHHYGYTRNQRYRFLNVLEEIDLPGEWAIDREAGIICFLPPAPPAAGDVVLSVLDQPLVRLDNARHVELSGFEFCYSRGSGVVITGGEHCTVSKARFHHLGGEAVTIDGGRRHTVQDCDLFHLANGAIRVAGGDRATLVPGGHRVSNNHIHHFSEWLRTGQYGVMIDGVGHTIANNLIHDAPFEAMYLRGNDHVVEFNEVHRVCLETGDAGGIHTGRDYTWQGNIIRYNYWHHLKGPGLHGVTAVYLDDFSSGFTIHGNIFYRAGRGVQLGGGRDNVVTNNLFIECEPAMHLDARGLGWAGNYFDGRYPWLFERFKEMNADQPPYSSRYPKLKTLLHDSPAVPKGNVIRSNLSWGGRWIDLYDFWAWDFHGLTVMRDNWIADPLFVRRRAVKETTWDPYYINIDGAEGYRTWRSDEPETLAEFKGNRITREPPGRFDPRTKTFTPANADALREIGFERIPVEKIGLNR
jgi:hypothetical protein